MSAHSLFDAVGLAPSLPGAKCRGRHRLFDAPEPGCHPDDAAYAEQAALRLCSVCPSLPRCRMWLEALPGSQWPLGVVAGVVRRPRPPGRARRSA